MKVVTFIKFLQKKKSFLIKVKKKNKKKHLTDRPQTFEQKSMLKVSQESQNLEGEKIAQSRLRENFDN